jgi:hypothetical protein
LRRGRRPSAFGFRSLGDTWADTTTPHGRLMLTALGGLAEFERELIRVRTSEGRARAVANGVKLGRKPTLTPHQPARGDQARQGRKGNAWRDRAQLQRQPLDYFKVDELTVASMGCYCPQYPSKQSPRPVAVDSEMGH